MHLLMPKRKWGGEGLVFRKVGDRMVLGDIFYGKGEYSFAIATPVFSR